MEYNQPSEIVKDVNFGDFAKKQGNYGRRKARKSSKINLRSIWKVRNLRRLQRTSGHNKRWSNRCGSVVLFDPVENMGATLIKEAS